MPARRVAISRACQQACVFCDVAETLDRRPVPPEAATSAVDAAADAGADAVVLSGGEPTLSGSLFPAIGRARARGLRVVLRTNGRLLAEPSRAGRLKAVGVDGVTVALHAADPALHQELVGGDPLAHPQAVAALRSCAAAFPTTLATVLTRTNAGEVEALVGLAAEIGAAFELRPMRPEGAGRTRRDLVPEPAERLTAWRRAEAAARAAGVAFFPRGFDDLGLRHTPAPPAPVGLGEGERALLRAGLADPSLRAGLLVGDGATLAELAAERRVPPRDLPLLLAARNLPLADVPEAAGGLGTHPTPPDVAALLGTVRPPRVPAGRTWAVVVPSDADAWLALSTLPGLRAALTASGAEARLLSPFRGPAAGADPFAPPPPARPLDRLAGLVRKDPDDRPWSPDALAAGAGPGARLDLRSGDRVLLWGWRGAPAVRRVAPDLPRVILDPELLAGFDGILGPQDLVISPWPSRARAYVAAGVPLERVLFRPLPVSVAHLPQARPSASRTILLAGPVSERLRAAAPPNAAVAALPAAAADLRRALAGARLLWIPAAQGAAVSPLLLAQAAAAGLGVVASEVPATADHVRPDAGRLVRPDEPDDHAAALAEALADDRLVDAWGAAARTRGDTTAGLARELVEGLRTARSVPWFSTGGPYGAW